MDGSDVRCIILFAVCLVDQNATHIRLLAQVSGSLADEDIIAKLLVESDPYKSLRFSIQKLKAPKRNM